MKQKVFIFGFLLLMAIVLIGLNAASYTQKEKTPDSEASPNRSTFNTGATGTQGLYSLLAETGRNVSRWQQSPAALLPKNETSPEVFVLVGGLRRQFTPVETDELLRWVAEGGRLVIIDRTPNPELLTTTANWKISVGEADIPLFTPTDPSDPTQMTAETAAVKPVQPSVYTQNVNAVQPSKFAAPIEFERYSEPREESSTYESVETPSQNAPIAHIATGERNLVVAANYGGGQIVILSDPYIVSNGGIGLVDNAQLAVNLVAVSEGVIAFDEFHQGYGSDNNRFLQFFAGTPVIAIFLQVAVIVGLLFFSQSRRFARPVPESQPDRLSKLEYVSAMAELQNRTKAFDLAIENIYHDFRRRVSRHFGLDNTLTKSPEIAASIAERTGMKRELIAETMFKCEEIIRGEPTTRKQTLKLIETLREIEEKLGLRRAAKTRAGRE